MKALIHSADLKGVIPAIASKSFAHRLLIAAALADQSTVVHCPLRSEDILATVRVLSALGAEIVDQVDRFDVTPITMSRRGLQTNALLDCGESGTTARFILPIIAALGHGGALTGHGRLPQRPLSPLYEVLVDHGLKLSPQGTFPLTVEGQLVAGDYAIAGNVSSQFVGGLLFALSITEGRSTLTLTETIESAPYIRMTLDVLRLFGVDVMVSDDERVYRIVGQKTLKSPRDVTVEADWSNAAFWLAAGAVGSKPITLSGITSQSSQGDRAVLEILCRLGAKVDQNLVARTITVSPAPLKGQVIDAAQIPDLVPILSIVAACAEGTTTFVNAGRLRIKESDRLETTGNMLRALGVEVDVLPEGLVVHGRGQFTSATVSGANDHRIVMSAAIAALRTQGVVTIEGAQAVRKSYPHFFEDFSRLGGLVTLEIDA